MTAARGPVCSCRAIVQTSVSFQQIGFNLGFEMLSQQIRRLRRLGKVMGIKNRVGFLDKRLNDGPNPKQTTDFRIHAFPMKRFRTHFSTPR